MPPVEDADVVIGYRADDSYFNYADAFVNNALSLRRLGEAMRLGRPGQQIALRTERAFSQLDFAGAEMVPWDVYRPRYVARDDGSVRARRSRRPGRDVRDGTGQRLFRELRATEDAPGPVPAGPGRSPECWGGWAWEFARRFSAKR